MKGHYCADRKPPVPSRNEWKVCMLELGHNSPHKSSDGTRWPREEKVINKDEDRDLPVQPEI